MKASEKPFRILSLDGGGSWALIQVRTLMAIYGDVRGHEVLRDFDLVVANSGGSITTGALYSNVMLSDALDFFKTEEWRRKMFVEKTWPIPDITRKIGIGPRYQAKEKLVGLRDLFGPNGAGRKGGFAVGDLVLTELPALVTGEKRPHVLIMAFDYWRRRASFFRSDPSSPTLSSQQPPTTLAEAIHASSNAPINYFDEPAKVGGRLYWDGGISGYNNPIMAGITEALAKGIDPTHIGVLSIGTGTVLLPQDKSPLPDPLIYEEYPGAGPIDGIMELAKSILDDPPDAATYMAHVLLGGLATDAAPPVIRLNPLIQPIWDQNANHWRPLPANYRDDFKMLRNLDMDAVKQEEVLAIDRLCDRWLSPAQEVPNQPIQWERQHFICKIGHRWAGDAIADWR